VAACGVALVLTGAAFTIYTSMSNATVQLAAPDRLRGRAMAVYGYVFIGSAPLGGLLAGWLSAVGGTQLAFLVAGGVSLMAVLVATGLQRVIVPARGTARRPGANRSTAQAGGRIVSRPETVSPSRERTVA
jgi:MFS family permease